MKIKLKKKNKYIEIKDNYVEKTFTKINTTLTEANVISNGKYTVVTNLNGEGYSKLDNLLINRYKETSDYKQGIFFYIKNLNTKQV